MAKLNYKIVGRRPQEGFLPPQELVDVEWTHTDGPFKDTLMLPVSHPPVHPSMGPVQYKEFAAEPRAVIKDQITVPEGMPDEDVEVLLVAKRKRLAEAIGVEP